MLSTVQGLADSGFENGFEELHRSDRKTRWIKLVGMPGDLIRGGDIGDSNGCFGGSAAQQGADLAGGSREFRVLGKVGLMKERAVDQVLTFLDDAAFTGIGRDQHCLGLPGAFEQGTDFQGDVTAEDGIDLFINPLRMVREDPSANLSKLGGGLGGRERAGVGVNGQDLGLGIRGEVLLDFRGEAKIEGGPGQFSGPAQVICQHHNHLGTWGEGFPAS